MKSLIKALKNEKYLEHQSVKVQNKIYNLNNKQLNKYNNNNVEDIFLSPLNKISSVTNFYVDFKLNSIPN
jgi:hypothetical protein